MQETAEFKVLWEGVDSDGFPGVAFLRDGELLYYSYITQVSDLSSLIRRLKTMCNEALLRKRLREAKYILEAGRVWKPEIPAAVLEELKALVAVEAL